jgi:hypothetical protein
MPKRNKSDPRPLVSFRVVFVFNPTGERSGREFTHEYILKATTLVNAKKKAYEKSKIYENVIKFVMYWPVSKRLSVIVPMFWDESQKEPEFGTQFTKKLGPKERVSQSLFDFTIEHYNSGGE